MVAAPVVEGEDEAPALGVVDERRVRSACRAPRSLPPPGGRSGPSRSASVPPPRSPARLGLGQASQRGRGFSAASGSIALGREPPPGLGVEPPADRLGGAGELGRMRRQLGMVDQVAGSRRARARCPPCGVSARRVAPARRPARRGRPVARRPRHRPARARSSASRAARSAWRSPLRAAIQARSASTRAWVKRRRGQMGSPRARPRRAGRRPGPSRAGRARPRGRRAEPARTASSQSSASSKRPARVARSARASQTRSSSGATLSGLLEFLATPLDRIRLVVDLPEGAQVFGGIALALDLPAQEAPVIVVPAGHPVEVVPAAAAPPRRARPPRRIARSRHVSASP